MSARVDTFDSAHLTQRSASTLDHVLEYNTPSMHIQQSSIEVIAILENTNKQLVCALNLFTIKRLSRIIDALVTSFT